MSWTVMTNTALGVTKPQATNISDLLTCDIMLSSTKPTLENYLSCKNVLCLKHRECVFALLFIVCVRRWVDGATGVLLHHCLALSQRLFLNVELSCQPANPRALTFSLASPPTQQTLHGFALGYGHR